MKNIKFKGETMDELEYNPTKYQESFYQICQFKNPTTKLYETRKILFDHNFNIIKIFEKNYDSNTIKKFMKSTCDNKFRLYPTNKISDIDNPNGGELMNVRSDLTNNSNKKVDCFDSFSSMMFSGISNYNCLASPGADISDHCRKIGNNIPNFYNGAPKRENLQMINNNIF
jgi:hypothetical protein